MTMPGEYRPYFLVDRVTPTGATGTFELAVGATEEFEGSSIFFIASAGVINLVRISDSSGTAYSNCNATDVIPSAVFLTALDQRTQIAVFATPLKLGPNTRLFIEFAGATGAANLDCVIVGKMRSV